MNKRIWLIFALSVFIISVAAVLFTQYNSNPQDIQLFADRNCVAACWQGLRISQTNSQQVSQILGNNPFNIIDSTTVLEASMLIYAQHESGYRVNALIEDNNLQRLELSGAQLEIIMGDIVNILGEPDAISYSYSPSRNSNEFEASMMLYYPEYGTVFILKDSKGLSANLSPNDDIEICVSENASLVRVMVNDVGTIDDLLESIKSPFSSSGVTRDMLRDWSGYGCFIAQ